MKRATIHFIIVLLFTLVLVIGISVFLMFMAFIVFGSTPEILMGYYRNYHYG